KDFLVPNQDTPHFLLRPQVPLKQFLTRYLELGGSHHVAVTPGDQTSRISKCARLLGLRVDTI
ncbi:MAG: hypothetical protein ABFD94_00980, partial [Armatimonadia bacterium]